MRGFPPLIITAMFFYLFPLTFNTPQGTMVYPPVIITVAIVQDFPSSKPEGFVADLLMPRGSFAAFMVIST